MPPQQEARILEPSVKSLFIQMRFNEAVLATGTGFVINGTQGPLLITNRHNVTGRDQLTGQPLSDTGGIPNNLMITHNSTGRLGEWIEIQEPLLSPEGTSLWLEHPTLGARADFVALPLTMMDGVRLFPYDLIELGPNIAVAPAEAVSVVGFPFGIQVGGSTGIWATGFVASEPELNFQDLPVFLIDCRTRPGQSGSPVVAHRNGGAFTTTDGNLRVRPGASTRFLGIYSGRVNKESDLGFVWKATAIRDLVDSVARPTP